LEETGVLDDIKNIPYEDPTYNANDYPYEDFVSDGWQERGWVPETKKNGFTIFVETDSLLETKYHIPKGDIKALYDKACEIYDEVYPQDISATGHSFENLTDSVNPLRRFIQYHILNKIAASTDDLTPQEISNKTNFIGAIGIDENLVNPCDWHYTLLPHTMIKVDKITVNKYLAGGKKGDRYINRLCGSPLFLNLGTKAVVEQLHVTTIGSISGGGALVETNAGVIGGCKVIDDVETTGGALVGTNDGIVYACYHTGLSNGNRLIGQDHGNTIGCYQASDITSFDEALLKSLVATLNTFLTTWYASHPNLTEFTFVYSPASYPTVKRNQ
jgi:hypothetical protein